MSWRSSPGVAALAILLACFPASAGERLVRHLDWRIGAPMSSAFGLEQDTQGFLWITTPEGIVRYDGSEFRVVKPAGHAIIGGCAAAGRVLALGRSDAGWELNDLGGDEPRTSPLPAGVESSDEPGAVCSDDGSVWLLYRGLWRRSASAGWSPVESTPARVWDALWVAPGGKVLARSAEGVFLISPDGGAVQLARLRNPTHCLLQADGTLITIDWLREGAHLLRVRDGQAREMALLRGRPLGLVERHGTIWAAFDGGLVGVGPDGGESRLESFTGTPFVDREGALWVATSQGLSQLPEPETAGIDPPLGGRWLQRGRGGLTMSTWVGARQVVEEGGRWTLRPFASSIGAICDDARGRRWGASFDAFSRTETDGHLQPIPFARLGDLYPCVLDGGGTLWMPTLGGLLRLPRDEDLPREESLPPTAGRDAGAYAVLLDGRGRLLVGMDHRVCVCEAPAAPVRSWRCEPIPGEVTDLLEVDGRVWAAARDVYAQGDDAAWRRMEVKAEGTSAPIVSGLAPSPRGGMWLLGTGPILRVAAAPEAGRLRVLEHLGPWQGIPTYNSSDAVEDDDGTVWVATLDASLVRVPASVRSEPTAPARVAITSLNVDGERVAPDRTFRSPYRKNRLEVRVSAFSYRDPSRARYRFRMRDEDPWSEPTTDPLFHFYNLAAGTYSLRFAASLDGVRWTETASPVAFRIDRPWFLQAWFFGVISLAMLAIAYAFHRARLAKLLALERQRGRIAMDLHDAIGSGLGSIGLLAAVGSRPGTAEGRRRELSDQIASMAGDLGTSLSDIVWSLRPGSERLEAVARYLNERANALFVDDKARLVVDFPPSWPDERLSLPLRRSLILIALEALHNAARHAAASEVRLGMARDGAAWSLWVEDDGLGVEHGVAPGSGMGLDNMRRRAAEIGARVEWTAVAPRGTRVTLTFDPRFDGGT